MKNQILILLFLFLTIDQVKGQNDCIINQQKFSEYLYRNFNIHPLKSSSKNKYIAYSIQFTIHKGKIAGFVYSPETPETVIIRNDITLRGINSKMKELGVEFLNDFSIFVPVLYIWNHPEKDKDNLAVVSKHLSPENPGSKFFCIMEVLRIVIDEPK